METGCNNRYTMPSNFRKKQSILKGDTMHVFKECEKTTKCSGTTYVYDKEYGWIDVKLFLSKVKEDLNKIEKELGVA